MVELPVKRKCGKAVRIWKLTPKGKRAFDAAQRFLEVLQSG